jgi:hypothetical protein
MYHQGPYYVWYFTFVLIFMLVFKCTTYIIVVLLNMLVLRVSHYDLSWCVALQFERSMDNEPSMKTKTNKDEYKPIEWNFGGLQTSEPSCMCSGCTRVKISFSKSFLWQKDVDLNALKMLVNILFLRIWSWRWLSQQENPTLHLLAQPKY